LIIQKQALTSYQKAILNALKDVSTSLAAYWETQDHREKQIVPVASAADAGYLARLRYPGGDTSYIEVLATDTDLYDAQLKLADAESQEADSLV
jgi:multidrug efflux system outer membrane protein